MRQNIQLMTSSLKSGWGWGSDASFACAYFRMLPKWYNATIEMEVSTYHGCCCSVRCCATENPKYDPASPFLITGSVGSRLNASTAACNKNKHATRSTEKLCNILPVGFQADGEKDEKWDEDEQQREDEDTRVTRGSEEEVQVCGMISVDIILQVYECIMSGVTLRHLTHAEIKEECTHQRLASTCAKHVAKSNHRLKCSITRAALKSSQ